MGSSKNETIQYSISTNEMVQYSKGTVTGIVLHYYLINIVVNRYIQNHIKSLINNTFTVVSIIKGTFKDGTI